MESPPMSLPVRPVGPEDAAIRQVKHRPSLSVPNSCIHLYSCSHLSFGVLRLPLSMATFRSFILWSESEKCSPISGSACDAVAMQIHSLV
ncbi:hypothetical protein FKM82_023607 [Ascaphus truei]